MAGIGRGLCALLAALAASAPGTSGAQLPDRPVTWIVPYAKGSIADLATRLLGDRMQIALRQPITVENRPGPRAVDGTGSVAQSAPDGHTLITVTAEHAINATLYATRVQYDAVAGFAPVSLAARMPLLMVASVKSGHDNAGKLIAYAKANPGQVAFGSSGNGTVSHLAVELFAQSSGIVLRHQPYAGFAASLQAVMAGNAQLMADLPGSLLPQVRGGRVRALGMLAARRVRGAADVPTLPESGGPTLEAANWLMILAPAGTPREILGRFSAETTNAVSAADTRTRFEQFAIQGVGDSPEAAAAFLAEEIAKWAKVIDTAGVKAEP